MVSTEEQVELSFTRMWDHSLEGKFVPLNIDKRSLLVKANFNFLDKYLFEVHLHTFDLFRFVMLRGSSGFYSYGIYEHLKDWPDFDIGETRITFKLRKDKYGISLLISIST